MCSPALSLLRNHVVLLKAFISATVHRRCVPNDFVAPCGAFSIVQKMRTLMTRLAIVLGQLIEALKGLIHLVALTIYSLSKTIYFIFYILD